MNSITALKTKIDDLEVEYEILSPIDINAVSDPRQRELAIAMQSVDQQLEICQTEVDKLNNQIDRLTNHADNLDYTIAVASGILTGLIDSFFVGEINLEECHEWGSDKVNNFIKKIGKSDDLSSAIKNLEKKSKPYFASDPNLNDFGGGTQHHFRDFAHHPTLIGLAFSLLTQFSGNCYGTNTAGRFIIVPVIDKSRIGDTPYKKILCATVYWFLHLVSDMAGTNTSAGQGTGLPGPILAFAKELSALPIFQNVKIEDMNLSVFLSKLFNGTLYAERDAEGRIIKTSAVRMDLRTELGMLHKQAFPVIMNDIFVRVFYALRRLYIEIKSKTIPCLTDLKMINWKQLLPVGNRTVVRMLTIASGTFTAVDMADAAIRSAAKSGGDAVTFLSNFILRVNFVGIGRFAIACGTDIAMGIKREKLRNERMHIMSQELFLLNAKVYYKQANLYYAQAELFEKQEAMWLTAADTEVALQEAYEVTANAIVFYQQSLREIYQNLNRISTYLDSAEENNPGIKQDMLNILKWGL